MKFDKSGFSNDKLLELYKSILKPRMIEEKMLILLRQGKISNGFQVLVKKQYQLESLQLWVLMNIYCQCIET